MTAIDRSQLPTVAVPPAFTFPSVAKRTLSGGLGLWCVERSVFPLVSLAFVVPAGSGADPAPFPGLASLTGDMLDEGSSGRTALEVHEAFAQIGAQLAVEVGADATLVGLTVLSRHLDAGLELLADCVTRPNLLPDDVGRVLQLRRSRLEQLRMVASAVADRQFMQTLYEGHPYGHLAIGTEASLERMTAREVVAFHGQAYRPDRSTVIAVGDVRADRLADLVERHFGDWAARGLERDALPGTPPDENVRVDLDAALADPAMSPSARLVVVDRPGAAQSEVRVGHVGLARDTPDHPTLLVLNAVLGGQFVSRLNLKLREEKGYTYGVRTSFEFRRGRGPFLLQTSVQTEMTAPALEEVFAILRSVRTDRPVDDEELNLAKAALTRGYARSFETGEQLARALVQRIVHGLPDDYYDTFPARVTAVDTAGVAHAAEAHLHPDRMLTLLVGDRTTLQPALAAAGL